MKRLDGKPRAERRPINPRPCARCGEVFQPKSNRVDKKYCSQACYDVARRETKIHRVCVECGAEFLVSPSTVLKEAAKYCSRECFFRNHPRPSSRRDVADKIAAAKTTHGRSTGRRQRQLEHAGCTIQAKGESRCRACGDERLLQLHHAIPRSLWRDGVLQPLNCIPLCVPCHMGWHHRRVTIYRDVFTPEEWGCLLSANLTGRVVEAWLDDRYPVRPA